MALEAVQAQAGHVSIESTRVYLHLTNDWLANEYRLAAGLIDAGHAAELIALEAINS
jgi:integrase